MASCRTVAVLQGGLDGLVAKVADFGCASTSASPAQRYGTLEYACPECLDSDAAGAVLR